MKHRIPSLLIVLCLFIILFSFANAETPYVSFAQKTAEINGGMSYTVEVLCNPVPQADLSLALKLMPSEDTLNVVIPAGKSSVSFEYKTKIVERRETHTFSMLEGEGYAFDNKDNLKLTVHTLPSVSFYLDLHLGYVGKKISIPVTCANAFSVLKDNNIFELRDQTGRVFDQKQWRNPNERLYFNFEVTSDMEGKHLFSVWLNGIEVSRKTGYGAITDLSRPPITTIDTKEPYMSITIDCAYADYQTDAILEVLDKYNVKATFFMTGYFVRTFGDSVKKIINAGHEIGNHSNTHPHMLTISEYDRMRQIQIATDRIMSENVTPRLFRPPFGEFDKTVTALARAEGQELVMWTIDSHDWDTNFTQERVVQRVTRNVGPGTIILFHLDGFGAPKTFEEVIPYYQNELGLTLIPVSELMKLGGRELPPLMQ